MPFFFCSGPDSIGHLETVPDAPQLGALVIREDGRSKRIFISNTCDRHCISNQSLFLVHHWVAVIGRGVLTIRPQLEYLRQQLVARACRLCSK